MHEHRARRRAVDGAHEPLGLPQRVIVRHERQPADVSAGGPRRVAAEDEVRKGDLLVAGGGGLGGGVVDVDGPLWQVFLEEGEEVVLGGEGAVGAGDARDEDRGEERALFDVEVGVARGDAAEDVVGERGVGGGEGDEKEGGGGQEAGGEAPGGRRGRGGHGVWDGAMDAFRARGQSVNDAACWAMAGVQDAAGRLAKDPGLLTKCP